MLKTGRWRNDKNKIKALFILHFHATGVAQVVGDSLVISLIPADVGKPTVRSDEAVIQEGSCYWKKPIHESLKFFTEPRTGKLQEKIYYFVISNGWSKTGFVGEVSIDFSTYAESFKVSSVSLPLKNAKCDALLHVSIQRVQEDVSQREIEEIETATTLSNDKSSKVRLNNSDAGETIKGDYTCAPSSPFYDEITVIPERKRNDRESCGSDLTMSSSESTYGIDTPTNSGFKDNIVHRDPTSVLPTIEPLPESTSHLSTTRGGLLTSTCLDSTQSGATTSAAADDVVAAESVIPKQEPLASSLPTTKGMHLTSVCLGITQSDTATSVTPNDMAPIDWNVSKPKPVAKGFPKAVHKEHPIPQVELLAKSSPEATTDDTSDSPPRDVLPIEKSEDSSSLLIDELRAEISTLTRKSQVAELELKTLRKQIVKESRKGQELLKEVAVLKDERNALRIECEKSKPKNKFEKGDPFALIEELRQEVYYEKEHNDNLQVQLMKMQESNSELILAIRELDEMLEQKDNEIINLLNNSKSETGDEEEQKIADLYNELEMHRRVKEQFEGKIEQLVLDYDTMKQENHDLSYQLEKTQMPEQLKLQYECSSYATISELETQVVYFENELKEQSSKFSEALEIISELEEHAKGMVDDLEKQAQGFEDDIKLLTRDNIELEKRAISAEEALRKTRWQNADAAEKIHEEFRRLSVEMISTLESNENFTKDALSEVNELRMQKTCFEDLIKESKEELRSLTIQYEEKLNELLSQLNSKDNDIEKLQNEKTRGEENYKTLSEEILMLTVKIEMLKTENNSLSAEAKENWRLKGELEQVNVSMRSLEMVLEREKAEKSAREREIVQLQEEACQSVDELNSLRKEKDEMNNMIGNLQSELERLQNQHAELKINLSEDQLEKDNLKNIIKLLQGQIKLKEAALETTSESYLEKEKNFQNKIEVLERENSTLSAEAEEKQRLKYELEQVNVSMRELEAVLERVKAEKSERERKLVQLQEKTQHLFDELKTLMKAKEEKNILIGNLQSELETCQNQHDELKHLLSEEELEKDNLKNIIKLLKGHIRMKEAALETSTKSYLEKEKDFQNIIEDLERRLEDSQMSAIFLQKVDEAIFLDAVACKVSNMASDELNTVSHLSTENGVTEFSLKSKVESCGVSSRNQEGICESSKEIALLKERNREMEYELKEMQERYSEISLKLAEVEGARQQLMMRVRNLKNSKKS